MRLSPSPARPAAGCAEEDRGGARRRVKDEGVRLTLGRVREILRVSAELYDATTPAAARSALPRALASVVPTRVTVVTIADDFRAGGRARMGETVTHGFSGPAEQEAMLASYSDASRDPAVAMLEARRARAPVVLRRDVVADADWYRSEFVQANRIEKGYDDAIYGAVVVGAGRAVGVGLHREVGDRPFSEEDREAVALLLEFAPRLDLLGSPEAPQVWASLPRRERETLDALLSGASEKEAAARLGVTASTLHGYVKSLYRRLGVRSRAELFVRFGARRGPP